MWFISGINKYCILLFKSIHFPAVITPKILEKFNSLSNRRQWLCFSQIRTRWSSQQTVGGQGSEKSEYLERKRLCVSFLLMGKPEKSYLPCFYWLQSALQRLSWQCQHWCEMAWPIGVICGLKLKMCWRFFGNFVLVELILIWILYTFNWNKHLHSLFSLYLSVMMC